MPIVKQFFITSLLLSACGAVNYVPKNEAVVAGRDVTLHCGSATGGTLQWKHRQVSGEETSLTYNRNITSDHRRLRLNTTIVGRYDLLISQVDRSDAGTYICIKNEKQPTEYGQVVFRRYNAQLVILSSHPSCALNTLNTIPGKETLLENEYVQMQCHVRYFGNLVPVMEWRREGQLMDAAQINTTARNQNVRSSLLVQVNSSDNGVRFSCDVFFAPIKYNDYADELLIKADNTPEYKYAWRSPHLDVLYGPRNLTIRLIKESDEASQIMSGCRLECYADGNPTPRYEWTMETEQTNLHLPTSASVFIPSHIRNQHNVTSVECKAINNVGESTGKKDLPIFTSESTSTATCNVVSDSKAFLISIMLAITTATSMTACIVLIIRNKKVKEGHRAATDSAPPARLSKTEYSEVHEYASPCRYLLTNPNIDLHQSGYTDLKVSHSRQEQPVI